MHSFIGFSQLVRTSSQKSNLSIEDPAKASISLDLSLPWPAYALIKLLDTRQCCALWGIVQSNVHPILSATNEKPSNWWSLSPSYINCALPAWWFSSSSCQQMPAFHAPSGSSSNSFCIILKCALSCCSYQQPQCSKLWPVLFLWNALLRQCCNVRWKLLVPGNLWCT